MASLLFVECCLAVRLASLFMAPLVQLDRMSAYGADGRRFESCTGCLHFCGKKYLLKNVLLTGLEPAIFALGGRRLIH